MSSSQGISIQNRKIIWKQENDNLNNSMLRRKLSKGIGEIYMKKITNLEFLLLVFGYIRL